MKNPIKCGFPQKFTDAFVGSNRTPNGDRQTAVVSKEYKEVLEFVKEGRELAKHAISRDAMRKARRKNKKVRVVKKAELQA